MHLVRFRTTDQVPTGIPSGDRLPSEIEDKAQAKEGVSLSPQAIPAYTPSPAATHLPYGLT